MGYRAPRTFGLVDIGKMTLRELEELEARGGPDWEAAQNQLEPMLAPVREALGVALAPTMQHFKTMAIPDFGVLRNIDFGPQIDFSVLGRRNPIFSDPKTIGIATDFLRATRRQALPIDFDSFRPVSDIEVNEVVCEELDRADAPAPERGSLTWYEWAVLMLMVLALIEQPLLLLFFSNR